MYALVLQAPEGANPDSPHYFNDGGKILDFVDANVFKTDSYGLPLNDIETECYGGSGSGSVKLTYGSRRFSRKVPQLGLYDLVSDTDMQTEVRTESWQLDYADYLDPDATDPYPNGIGWDSERGIYEGAQMEVGYQTWSERWGFPPSYNNTYMIDLYARAARGTVNQYAFRGCEPGTVRCNGVSHRMIYSAETNSRLFDVTFSFSWRPNTYDIPIGNGLVVPRKYGWGYVETVLGYDRQAVIDQGDAEVPTFPIGVKHHLVYPPFAYALFETYPYMNIAELRNRFLVGQ